MLSMDFLAKNRLELVIGLHFMDACFSLIRIPSMSLLLKDMIADILFRYTG